MQPDENGHRARADLGGPDIEDQTVFVLRLIDLKIAPANRVRLVDVKCCSLRASYIRLPQEGRLQCYDRLRPDRIVKTTKSKLRRRQPQGYQPSWGLFVVFEYRLDRTRTATAFCRAAERGIDLLQARTRCSAGYRRSYLAVAEDVATTDDHDT